MLSSVIDVSNEEAITVLFFYRILVKICDSIFTVITKYYSEVMVVNYVMQFNTC